MADRQVQRVLGRALPSGAGPVSVGLVVAGLTAYGFLVLSGRALGPAGYAALSSLWFVGFLTGQGLFQPLEQELASAVAARRSAGHGGAPVARRAAGVGLAASAALVAAAAAAHRPLRDRLFDDEVLLVVSLCLVLAGYAFEHFSRGLLAGSGAFRPYGVLLGAEGSLRLAGCAALALAGVARPGPFGLLVGLAPIVATALTVPAWRPALEPGPPAPWRELSSNLAALVVASVFGTGLANAAPLAARVLSADGAEQAARVGAFQAGVVLTRTPLYLFAAVQAALLPALSALAAEGDTAAFRARLRTVLTGIGGVAALATVGAWVAGPFVLRLLFGSGFRLGGRDLGLLALASAGHMACLALSQALIALRRHSLMAAGWVVGVAAFAAVLVGLDGRELLLLVELAFVAGEGAAVAALGVAAWRSRAGGPGWPATGS